MIEHKKSTSPLRLPSSSSFPKKNTYQGAERHREATPDAPSRTMQPPARQAKDLDVKAALRKLY